MKKVITLVGGILILLFIIALFFPTWTTRIKGENPISVIEEVEINGSNHVMMIRGKDKDNPVIIMVHGGPGISDIPYAKKYEALLEDKFTVVHYDQRASGKSYHFFEDYNQLSTDLLVDDLLAVTDYISKRLDKEKVILMGHSFGTYIGLEAASKAPDIYEAYIGIGQMSDIKESEINSLTYCISQATKAGNKEDVSYLQGLTEKVKSGTAVVPRNYVTKYGGNYRLIENPSGNIAKLLSSEYNLLDVIRFNLGANYSQQMLLKDLLENPITTKVSKVDTPVYFVMGKYDYMTTSDAAYNYFNSIIADNKQFVEFKNSAHYPHYEEKEKFYQWMTDTFKGQ